MTIEDISRELGFFAAGVVRLNPPAAGRDVTLAEFELDVRFSPSMRDTLSAFDGGFVVNEPVFGVPPIPSGLDLVLATRQARTYWGPIGWLPSYVEVGNDGAGNPYVLLLDRRDSRGESPVGLFDAGLMEVTEVVASSYVFYLWFLIQDAKWRHQANGAPHPREPMRWTRRTVVAEPEAPSPWRSNEAWMLAHDPGLARWR